MSDEKTLLSPNGRVSFPCVYEPTKFDDDPNSKAMYSVTLIFDHKNMEGQQLELLKRMKSEANALAKKTFGCEIGQRDGDGSMINSPFRATEEKPKYYDPGMVFVRFANKYKPNVVNGRKEPISEASDDFYSGCWARVSFTIYTYSHKGNKGVSFSLSNVQKTGDDEPFAARRTSVDDDFDEVDMDGPVSVSADGYDDIPF